MFWFDVKFDQLNILKRWFPLRVLRTLQSLFTFFVLFHVRHHKMGIFHKYLHEVNSKYHVSRQKGFKASSLVLSHITRWNNFAAVKINDTVGKRVEWPQKKGMWFVLRIRSIRIPSSKTIRFVNIGLLRLRSTDWKSILLTWGLNYFIEGYNVRKI